jgi:hypothetical protein
MWAPTQRASCTRSRGSALATDWSHGSPYPDWTPLCTRYGMANPGHQLQQWMTLVAMFRTFSSNNLSPCNEQYLSDAHSSHSTRSLLSVVSRRGEAFTCVGRVKERYTVLSVQIVGCSIASFPCLLILICLCSFVGTWTAPGVGLPPGPGPGACFASDPRIGGK